MLAKKKQKTNNPSILFSERCTLHIMSIQHGQPVISINNNTYPQLTEPDYKENYKLQTFLKAFRKM